MPKSAGSCDIQTPKNPGPSSLIPPPTITPRSPIDLPSRACSLNRPGRYAAASSRDRWPTYIPPIQTEMASASWGLSLSATRTAWTSVRTRSVVRPPTTRHSASW